MSHRVLARALATRALAAAAGLAVLGDPVATACLARAGTAAYGALGLAHGKVNSLKRDEARGRCPGFGAKPGHPQGDGSGAVEGADGDLVAAVEGADGDLVAAVEGADGDLVAAVEG